MLIRWPACSGAQIRRHVGVQRARLPPVVGSAYCGMTPGVVGLDGRWVEWAQQELALKPGAHLGAALHVGMCWPPWGVSPVATMVVPKAWWLPRHFAGTTVCCNPRVRPCRRLWSVVCCAVCMPERQTRDTPDLPTRCASGTFEVAAGAARLGRTIHDGVQPLGCLLCELARVGAASSVKSAGQ